MADPVYEGQNFTRISSNTTISPGAGTLLGIWVSSSSATPTITVLDGTTNITGSFTPAGPAFYPIPTKFKTSLIVQIGGTVDCTVMWGT